MVRMQVSLWRFRFFNGFQYHACLGVLVGGILLTWPKYLNLRLNFVDLIDSAFALLRTSSVVMNSLHLMFKHLRKHLVWKLTSLCSIFGRFPCRSRSTDLLLLLNIFIFVFAFISSDRHILVISFLGCVKCRAVDFGDVTAVVLHMLQMILLHTTGYNNL